MSESRPHGFGGEKVVRVEPMANHAIVPNQLLRQTRRKFTLLPQMHRSMLVSLFRNIKDSLFPEKLPPLRLTSRPVQVRDIWTLAVRRKPQPDR